MQGPALHVEMVVTAPLVGTGSDKAAAAAHSGFVDLFDSRQGVRGWAVNMGTPMEPVRLQLCIGQQVVAETLASGEREDISAKLGRPAVAGFTFGVDVLLTIPDFLADPEERLSVRVAATGEHLPSEAKPLTAADILAQLKADAAPPERRSLSADMETMLDELQAGAAVMLDQALRPLPEGIQGYIETLAVDTAGHVWFMGWMRRGHLQEFGGVILDRRKYPAAVAVMSYARDDLPAEACGVIGLIASPWRPSSATAELSLFFGGGGRFHLRAHKPLRMVTSGELVSEYEGIRERCLGDGRVTVLQRMLTAMENWLPSRSAGQWYATETSIDRVLLVPGLGCLVEGWAISPIKRIEGLRLRVGGAVMTAHPESLYWKPRADLLGAFPGSEHMIRRAGFVGLFTGRIEPEDFADPVLKVTFQGGASANWTVASRVFRRLGHSATVEDALLFFPALQDEAFFPAFAEAAIRAEREAMNPLVAITVARSRRTIVLVLPEDRCDLFLVFESLAQHCRAGGTLEGLAFVASAQSNRSDALWLFREFQAAFGAPRGIACSLLVIDDAAQAFDLLGDILRELGTSRFLFIAAGVMPTAAGWALAAPALAPDASDLVFFGVQSGESGGADDEQAVSSRCFAWSTGHFARWALGAPSFMGGFYLDNTLRCAGGAQTVHHAAAICTRAPTPTRIAEAVNRAVYAKVARPAAPPAAPGGAPSGAIVVAPPAPASPAPASPVPAPPAPAPAAPARGAAGRRALARAG